MNNSDKIILDLCGGTGAWSKPYKDAGYDVRVITLPDYDILKTNSHLAEGSLYFNGSKKLTIKCKEVYGVLAAPPCTIFSRANWRSNKRDRDFKQGMRVVAVCMDIIWDIQACGALLKFWALENPMGYLYNFLGYPAYYFQPWWFGDTSFLATKRTALWGYFKKPTRTVRTRKIPKINSHSVANGQLPENKEWYSKRAGERAITPPGFAQAFFKANQ
jgi:hypothetical protein